ncbi:centromere protein H isoform X1 [Oxyura jamaicensis]|uniref:centromere protein H isoform X1 n=1 Tax=Oxyura jamaicensis TaxID=8884 RepID=UPI0015A550C5|nr:centromere protein H isoform X1 [Oxyura jamaicensis]
MAEPAGAEPGPAAEPEPGPAAEPSLGTGPQAKLDVLTLLRVREQLKQQLMECRAIARANQESCPDHDIEEMSIVRYIENLERELEELKTSFTNKTSFMQRIQLVDALRNKMTQNDETRQLIVETMKHTVKLSQAIIESQQQTREIEEKLNDIKKKRLILKQAEEDKLLQIRAVIKKKKELSSMEVGELLKSIHKNLQTERAMTTVIQNVFQNIIIGSRVNWAEDPSLKAVVLQLEKNISI